MKNLFSIKKMIGHSMWILPIILLVNINIQAFEILVLAFFIFSYFFLMFWLLDDL